MHNTREQMVDEGVSITNYVLPKIITYNDYGKY